MILCPPRATLTDPLCPYTTGFRTGSGPDRLHLPGRHAAGVGRGRRLYASRWICSPASDWLTGITSKRLMFRCGGRLEIHHTDSAMSPAVIGCRSEEHTSELQSLMRTSYDVFCLKKKPKTKY